MFVANITSKRVAVIDVCLPMHPGSIPLIQYGPEPTINNSSENIDENWAVISLVKVEFSATFHNGATKPG